MQILLVRITEDETKKNSRCFVLSVPEDKSCAYVASVNQALEAGYLPYRLIWLSYNVLYWCLI